MPLAVRASVPGRFGFSTYAEQLSASFRSTKQTGNFDAGDTAVLSDRRLYSSDN